LRCADTAALTDSGVCASSDAAFADRNVSTDRLSFSRRLHWWQVLWFHLGRHPVLLVIMTLLGGLVVALLLYRALRRRAARRLAAQA
jgi:hypothetical protein